MTTTWAETDLLASDAERRIRHAAAKRVQAAAAKAVAAVNAGRVDQATAQMWLDREADIADAERDAAIAKLHAPASTEQAAARHLHAVDDCASGSCQLARPGGPCDCVCGGTQHGARSTLAPAACHGTRLLVEPKPGGGYRYPRCPGCADCQLTRSRLTVVR